MNMNTYLAIITTALVATQIIRLVQNAVQLHRQKVLFKEQLGQLANCEPTEEDFHTQRKAYRLIVEYLEHRVAAKHEVSNEEVADHLISEGVTVRERGRWVDAYGIRKSKCASCGVAFDRVMDADCYYCPNCGAKMDGDGNG